jgi:hypothetical protein
LPEVQFEATVSMPMRRRPSSGSCPLRRRRLTRATIQPTVFQWMRIRVETAVRSVWTASQATWSSKERVERAPCSAQGTWATTTLCTGHFTRTARASR